MRSFITLLCIVFFFPGIAPAAKLQLEISPGFSEVYLLSQGTSTVLEHLRTRFDTAMEELNTNYQIDLLKELSDKAAILEQEKKDTYSNKFKSLRNTYLKSVSISIVGVDAEIFPSSSALAEVFFFFSIKNNSDRIITDINYKPVIGGIILPTTSSLILELIHPATLISGLGPGETLSNKGHNPEHFSFFIGELSKEELGKIQQEMKTHFTIEITDMHFTDKRGYKDQTRVMGFKEAFDSELKKFQIAAEKAGTDALAKKAAYDKALKTYNNDRDAHLQSLKESLEDLKKTSIRFQARADDTNRCIFVGIDAGNYIVYARNAQGNALFTEITVKDNKNKLMVTDLIKDPFTP